MHPGSEGLYGKYSVSKVDGTPIDPNAQYFVLRIDTDQSARIAVLAYAIAVEPYNRQLAIDLREWVSRYSEGKE